MSKIKILIKIKLWNKIIIYNNKLVKIYNKLNKIRQFIIILIYNNSQLI